MRNLFYYMDFIRHKQIATKVLPEPTGSAIIPTFETISCTHNFDSSCKHAYRLVC